MAKSLFLALLMLGCRAVSGATVSCLNEEGKPVDWWIVYKLPTISDDAQSNDGYGYAYTDAKKPLAIAEKKSLQDVENALGHTLLQIYEANAPGFIMWNDETPGGKTSSSMAHSKGVMGFDLKSGFLLRHSTPRFPNRRQAGYQGLPDFTKIYGQTFICASVDLATLNSLANQYLTAHPQVYDANVPEGAAAVGNLTALAKGTIGKSKQNILEFKTTGGTQMTDVVKSKACACGLWDDIIAPHYSTAMNVLSWGRPLEASACTLKASPKLQVKNVQNVTWAGGLTYKETNEHSKWGTTVDSKVLCIGDINRMTSQKKRGGGATCLTSPTHSAAFNKLVKDADSCGKA